ncbi:hypothetical protein GCM10009582_15850 [Arthrobacter flavus]
MAEPFAISKQAVSKHIQVLEHAQLVTRTRDAQRRPVHLNPARLEALTSWIDQYRLVRESQFRNLDALLHSTAAAGGIQGFPVRWQLPVPAHRTGRRRLHL